MAFKFSKQSLDNLSQCDHHLQILFNEVIKHRDCKVACGHRNKTKQDTAYYSKPQRSKLKWPNSKHNKIPSLAVDVYPYINGNVSYDKIDCAYFSGFVMGLATAMNMSGKIRCGGDWDGDGDTRDNDPNDIGHFEII